MMVVLQLIEIPKWSKLLSLRVALLANSYIKVIITDILNPMQVIYLFPTHSHKHISDLCFCHVVLLYCQCITLTTELANI